ncbi:uncharacterized protein I303_101698 [Kwoniella dejecticola CBS 10117]|uniref:Mitochondrial distribution and morphology protein 12 n=1 Tax=Kwoniella dejecticola CBS 10117 TaxID=1296121 RepID=A0A1A6AD17_9TREE|nr:uncharacterized protein I303_02166 [Kwoniella dejecticola CBS 10117]OBR87950.1 hypothetical protein I303_02166 [Kwoniella dejecticola CBS 10117]
MSVDIDWSLLNAPSGPINTFTQPGSFATDTFEPDQSGIRDELSESLITLLNEQLQTAKRPSFIGPITVTSFSFGDLGPDLEIKDIRDVWRVFDQGDEEGDEIAEEAEREERRKEMEEEERRKMERVGVYSELDEERYEYITKDKDLASDQSHIQPQAQRSNQSVRSPLPHTLSRRQTSLSRSGSYAHRQQPSGGESSSSRARTNRSLMLPRSTSNPHTLSSGWEQDPSTSKSASNSGKSYIPFPFDPHASGLGLLNSHNLNHGHGQGYGHGLSSVNGFEGLASSSSLFSPGLGRRPASIASLPLARPQSIAGSKQISNSARIQAQAQARQPGNRPSHALNQSDSRAQTQVHTHHHDDAHDHDPDPDADQWDSHIPPSPPAQPPKHLPQPSNSSSNSIPSLQLHLNLNFKSNLNLTLLTSLQVNYPSNLFMSLPLKISITGFEIRNEIIMAYSGEKNRLHVTILDQAEDQNQQPDNKDNNGGIGGEYTYTYTSRRNSLDEKKIPIGQKILQNLQIESEIGHSDAHVLRNVGKVERFIVDVLRKTLVEELVFPNFHTIAL